jgi:hypothetical protein
MDNDTVFTCNPNGHYYVYRSGSYVEIREVDRDITHFSRFTFKEAREVMDAIKEILKEELNE